jgi:hypothetical protein
MMNEEDIIRDLIVNDKIDEAIDLLAKSESNMNIDEAQLLILKNQWIGLKRRHMLGLMTAEEYTSRKNKYLESLLWLIDPPSMNIGKIVKELEDMRSENYELKQEVRFYRDKEDNYNGYRFEELRQLFASQTITIKEKNSWFHERFQYLISALTKNNLIGQQINYNDLLVYMRKDLYKYDHLFYLTVINFFGMYIDTGIIKILEPKNSRSEYVKIKLTEVGEQYLIKIIRELNMHSNQ